MSSKKKTRKQANPAKTPTEATTPPVESKPAAQVANQPVGPEQAAEAATPSTESQPSVEVEQPVEPEQGRGSDCQRSAASVEVVDRRQSRSSS